MWAKPEVVDYLWNLWSLPKRCIVVVIIELLESAKGKCGIWVFCQHIVTRHPTFEVCHEIQLRTKNRFERRNLLGLVALVSYE